jgi:hypothetical protein
MRRSSSSEAAVISTPFQVIVPAVGSISRLIQRSRVDFPEPLKPMTAKKLASGDLKADVV